MDTRQFDHLKCNVSRLQSRRVLAGALSLAVTTAFGLADDLAARKRRRKKKKKCKSGTAKCGKKCFDLATDGANCGACGNACPLDLCFHGACACVEDEDCPGECQCKPTVQGIFACASAPTQVLCVVDEDCPLGSFCLVSQSNRECTVACLG